MYLEQYVLRDSSKIVSNKDKSTYSLVPKKDDQQPSDKTINSASISGNEALDGENGIFEIPVDHDMLCFWAIVYVILMLRFLRTSVNDFAIS